VSEGSIGRIRGARCIVALGALGLAVVALAPRPAVADRAATDRAATDRAAADAARIDWAAGWVTAGGTGVADRHAPSPAVALGTSRRGAEDAARRRIAATLGALPLAAGGSVADRLADPAIKARIDAAVAAAIAIAAEPETDGSWHVTLAVPIEAIRLALVAPRALPAAGDAGPPVVIVDGVTGTPAVGWTIGGAAAATLWLPDAGALPAWAKDAPHVQAAARPAGGAASPAGSIAIDGTTGSPATLYVLVPRA
jgi:hypothetical protein